MLIIGWVLARRAGRAYAPPAKDPGGTETVVAVGLVTLPEPSSASCSAPDQPPRPVP